MATQTVPTGTSSESSWGEFDRYYSKANVLQPIGGSIALLVRACSLQKKTSARSCCEMRQLETLARYKTVPKAE